MPNPSTPALLLAMVSFFTPLRRTAAIRCSGIPHNPNPPIKIVAPSRKFAIAASAPLTRLSINRQLRVKSLPQEQCGKGTRWERRDPTTTQTTGRSNDRTVVLRRHRPPPREAPGNSERVQDKPADGRLPSRRSRPYAVGFRNRAAQEHSGPRSRKTKRSSIEGPVQRLQPIQAGKKPFFDV